MPRSGVSEGFWGTVDGRNLANRLRSLRLFVYPIIQRVLYTSQVVMAGFLPSTASLWKRHFIHVRIPQELNCSKLPANSNPPPGPPQKKMRTLKRIQLFSAQPQKPKNESQNPMQPKNQLSNMLKVPLSPKGCFPLQVLVKGKPCGKFFGECEVSQGVPALCHGVGGGGEILHIVHLVFGRELP